MQLIRLCFVTLLVFVFSAQAQQPSWNEAQMEVWDIVQKSWVDDAAENGNWPKDYVHENYVSWGADSGGPSYKASTIKWSRYSDESSSTLIYENSPASITVVGDTAVVNYYSTTVMTDSEAKRERSVTGISEVLIRDGKKWMFLSGSNFEPKMN
jgi:hypothetical protein